MSADDITVYKFGERIEIAVEAIAPDGSVIDLTGGSVIITIGETPSSDPTYEFNGLPQVTITNAAGGIAQIRIEPEAVPLLKEGVRYRFDVWTKEAAGSPVWQGGGDLLLGAALQPTI